MTTHRAVRAPLAALTSCFVLFAPPARADTPPPLAQVERGVVIEPHIGGGVVLLGGAGLGGLGGTALGGGLFGGYKLGRMMFGLSVNFGYNTYSTKSDSAGDSSSQSATLSLMPGMRVAVARTSDGRVELYGQVDVGYAHSWTSLKSSNSAFVSGPTGSDAVPFDAGVGVRLWVHPHYAVAACTLVQGSWFTTTSEGLTTGTDGTTMRTVTTTTSAGLSLGGALQILGVF